MLHTTQEILGNIVDANELERMTDWMELQDQKVKSDQLLNGDLTMINHIDLTNTPYYGRFGNGYTIKITPSSIGSHIDLSNNITYESIESLKE